ncbi:MAG: hypothetical protein IIA87_06010 [Nanoarchaeota archaeon]|nr:hypothetical protein [Nanoarchaeota archaeon]
MVKRKRGLAHIEVILAFVIFSGFLIFAFLFFSPVDNRRVLDSSLFYAVDEISDNISIILESYSVTINNAVPDIVGINITNPNNFSVRVETYSGENLSSNYDDGYVVFDRGGNNFVIVKFSEDFADGSLTGERQILSPENYTISSSDTKKILSEKGALILNQTYNENYLGLKKNFNLPNRIDFGFSLIFSPNDKIVAENNIPANLEVVVDEKRVEVIRQDGNIIFADLVVKVW